jgi:16S rRNA A1518/A1519 N6-dimethyltransferase RsmA/KsgA/DIM1 with predicted DNA glycosylase/AP lyase activity
VDNLVRAVSPRSTDLAVEIGTGTGVAARALAPLVERLVTFEIDEKILQSPETIELSTLDNVEIRRQDPFAAGNSVPHFDVCIASLPYSRSRDFLEWLSMIPFRFRTAGIIVQEEFARKLVAKPGNENYRAMSVLGQLSFEITLKEGVGREAFTPEPKVESRIVTLTPRENFPFFDDRKVKCLHFLFSRRRKLFSAIKEDDRISRSALAHFGAKRIESLTPEEFREILG